jgi:hypothetical protein
VSLILPNNLMPIPHLHTVNYFSAIMNHIMEMVMGVDRITGIYATDAEGLELSGIQLEYINGHMMESELSFPKVFPEYEFVQKEKEPFKWLDKTHLPFEQQELHSTKQLSIFSEYKHLLLQVLIPNPNGKTKDVVYILFKDNIDQFGVQHQKASLSTQNKSIIGHLVANSIISFAQNYKAQEEKHQVFAQKTHEILHSNRKITLDQQRKEELEKMILSWAKDLLEEYSKADYVNYVYQEDALKKILSYRGSFTNLKKAILSAIEYAHVMFTYVTSEKIPIEADYILLETEESTYVKAPTEQASIQPRLQKVYDLLDKLEFYALKVTREGLNLTSFNVGQAMERPITPAAISDAISKHRDRINLLFKQYPDRWSFIRHNFRPILNVLPENNTSIKNWG